MTDARPSQTAVPGLVSSPALPLRPLRAAPSLLAGLLLLLTAAAPFPAASGRGTEVAVTTLADDGAGSLRAAIEATNLVAGADVIVIDSNLEGIIELTSSLPGITESLTILGPGADRVAVDANETWRVLDFSAAPADSTFSLSGLTITGGRVSGDGGGIRLGEDQELTLDGIHLISNQTVTVGSQGGGIFVDLDSELTLLSSTIEANRSALGGGITSLGTVWVESSSVIANRASGQGGGIRALGDLRIYESTVAGNVVEGSSGGGDGGGIVLAYGELIALQSTIVGNQAVVVGGVELVAGATVASFGGNIVAGNLDEIGSSDCGTALGIVDAYNLSSDTTCGFSGASDLEATDPQLWPLRYAGGPTPTLVPRVGSPVIDAGSNGLCIALDQRGSARPVNGDGIGDAVCDIGSVEFTPGVDDTLLFFDGFESGDTAQWSSASS